MMSVHVPSGGASWLSCFSRRILSVPALALSCSVAAGSKSTAARACSFRRIASADLAFLLIGICHTLPSNPAPLDEHNLTVPASRQRKCPRLLDHLVCGDSQALRDRYTKRFCYFEILLPARTSPAEPPAGFEVSGVAYLIARLLGPRRAARLDGLRHCRAIQTKPCQSPREVCLPAFQERQSALIDMRGKFARTSNVCVEIDIAARNRPAFQQSHCRAPVSNRMCPHCAPDLCTGGKEEGPPAEGSPSTVEP